MQLMRLWWRQTDIVEASVGPAMAGRLRGTAFQFALSLRADRLDQDTGVRRIMVGDELLAQPSPRIRWMGPSRIPRSPQERRT